MSGARRGRRSPSLSIVPVEEAFVERVADIMGEGSASAKALAELRVRRAAGENVVLFRGGGMVLVGPPLAHATTEDTDHAGR